VLQHFHMDDQQRAPDVSPQSSAPQPAAARLEAMLGFWRRLSSAPTVAGRSR